MPRFKLFAALTALLCLPPALALEQNNSVKVATVLKTQSSWDGRPLAYPAGQAEVTGMLIEMPRVARRAGTCIRCRHSAWCWRVSWKCS